MNRRTILKAGIVIATSSHAAIASGESPSNQETLRSAMGEHARLCAKRKKLWAFVDDACDSAECPPFAKIKMSELGRDHRGGLRESKTLHWPAEIDADIDFKIGEAKWHVDNGITTTAHRARIERLEADRGKAHAILEARAKVYRDWRESSGVNAADAQSEQLCDAIEALERSIIDHQAQSLREASLKAEWLADNWTGLGEDVRREAARKLVIGRAA